MEVRPDAIVVSDRWLGVFGVIIMVAGGVMLARSSYVVATWEQGEATVLWCKTDSTSQRGSTHALEYLVKTAEGRKVRVRRELQFGECPTETTSSVRFPPGEPEEAHLGDQMTAMLVAPFIILGGIVLMLIGAQRSRATEVGGRARRTTRSV